MASRKLSDYPALKKALNNTAAMVELGNMALAIRDWARAEALREVYDGIAGWTSLRTFSSVSDAVDRILQEIRALPGFPKDGE